MKPQSTAPLRRLGEISRSTKGTGGPDIEMLGLWHKTGLAR
jgi:hypothetical protein